MRKRIISAIMSAACAFFVGAAVVCGNVTAKAAIDYDGAVSNFFSDSFTSGNCDFSKYATTYAAMKNDGTTVFKTYNGYNARFNGVGSYVEYKKAVDVTDNTTNDVIFEFIPAVETPGVGKKEFYKFSVYFIDEQSEDRYIKLEFKANGDYYTFVNASAKDGENELKPASKYQGVYKSDNGFQVGFGLSGLGGAKEFQSYKIYWDNTKKTMEVGSSREGNFVVRDFSMPDSELGIDGYTGTESFGGFTSGKVKIKVVAENVVTNYANMTFVSIDGEKLARPFGLSESEGEALVGDEVTLPSVTNCWNVKDGKAVETIAAEIKVTDPNGSETEVIDGKFTATKSGVYSAKYYAEQNGVTYVAEYKVTVGSNKNNDFYESFTATDCTPSDHAKTYTALTNKETVYKKYNGYHVKFNKIGSVVEYKNAIDVTDNTSDDIIFEFIPSVETQGTREFYKFNVYFVDEQDENKYIKLEFKANGQYYTFINASAKDGDKEFKPASKYQGVYASDADNDRGKGFQTGFGLSGYGGNQNFQSYRIYWDNAKKVMEVGASRESNNVVRDFSIPDGELGIEGYTGTEAFGGFTSGKVKIKVTVENNLLANQANMTFVSIDGESFARSSGVTLYSKGVVGRKYALPKPSEVFDTQKNDVGNADDVKYTVTVKDFDGEAVSVENGAITPTKAGEYELTYSANYNGSGSISKVILTVVSEEEAPAIELIVPVFEGEYFGNQTLGITADASCGLYYDLSYKPTVTLEISKDGGEFVSTELTQEAEFGYGKYELKYTATDYVGRTTEKSVKFEVRRNRLSLSEGVNETTVYDDGETPEISENDVVLFDVDLDGEPASKSVTIEVSSEDGEFELYDEGYKFGAGRYTVRYTVTYAVATGGETFTVTATRSIVINDLNPPVFGDGGKVENLYKDFRKDGDIYYVTTTGKTVKFIGFTASDTIKGGTVDLTSEIVVKYKKNDEAVRQMKYDKENGVSFVAEKDSVYYYSFVVSDGSHEVSRNYIIEVKDYWLTASFGQDEYEAEVGEEFSYEDKLSVKSIDGSVIDGVAIKWYFDEKEFSGKLVPIEKGNIVLKAEITAGEQALEVTTVLAVKASEKLEISVSGETLNVAVGEYFDVPKATVKGGNGKVTLKIYILTKDGTKKEVKGDSVSVDEEGEYTLVYEATDLGGTSVTKTIKVVATKKADDKPNTGSETENNGSSCGGSISNVSAAFALAALLIAAFAIVKKNNKNENI